MYGNYVAIVLNESKTCGEKTNKQCNGHARIFYLYTKLTKFVARSINLFISVAREVAVQPLGGLVPRNFNANIDASFI